MDIEKKVFDNPSPLTTAKNTIQKRKQVKSKLLEREKELKTRLATEQRTNPTAAIKTRSRLEKIQGELKRITEENKHHNTLQQIRRSTALADLTLCSDGVKPQK